MTRHAYTRGVVSAKKRLARPTVLPLRAERFAELVAEGMNYGKAYIETHGYTGAYPDQMASRLAANPKVKALILEIREDLRNRRVITREEKRQILASLARGRKVAPTSRIRAIEVENQMTGDNAPVKVEGEITLGRIFRGLVSSTELPIDVEARPVVHAAPEVPELPASNGHAIEPEPAHTNGNGHSNGNGNGNGHAAHLLDESPQMRPGRRFRPLGGESES